MLISNSQSCQICRLVLLINFVFFYSWGNNCQFPSGNTTPISDQASALLGLEKNDMTWSPVQCGEGDASSKSLFRYAVYSPCISHPNTIIYAAWPFCQHTLPYYFFLFHVSDIFQYMIDFSHRITWFSSVVEEVLINCQEETNNCLSDGLAWAILTDSFHVPNPRGLC